MAKPAAISTIAVCRHEADILVPDDEVFGRRGGKLRTDKFHTNNVATKTHERATTTR